MIDQTCFCRWCGRKDGSFEAHHLYRRSTHPELKDNPAVLVDLCFECHRRATDNHAFEEILQRAFAQNLWKN